MADEFCWLIERADTSTATPEYLYVTGHYVEYNPTDASGILGWTQSPNDALRFCRKIDAAMYAAAIRTLNNHIPHGVTLRGMREGDAPARICEHAFVSLQPQN